MAQDTAPQNAEVRALLMFRILLGKDSCSPYHWLSCSPAQDDLLHSRFFLGSGIPNFSFLLIVSLSPSCPGLLPQAAPKLQIPLTSCLLSLADQFCPLYLISSVSSPPAHSLFLSWESHSISNLCHECRLPPEPWFFPWRAICSHSTEKIILLTLTSASVPQHILFPLPATAHILLSTPVMAHTSHTRLTQA